MPTLADIIKKRIELRDEIARIKKVQAEELRPAYDACETLDQMMLDYFSREGCKRLATDSGTAHKKTTYNIRMTNRTVFLSWAHENLNDVEIRPNKPKAVDFLNKHKKPPPGVEVDGRFTVGYRRSGEPDEGEEIE